MPPRPVWRGHISFWMVNIPVQMFTVVRSHRVQFHMLHAKDGARLQEQFVCSVDKKVVTRREMVRGYGLSSDEYVVVKDEELAALAPKSSRLLEIMDFVDEAEIDPNYYVTGHWLLPEEQAMRSYALLNRAMRDARKVGITKFVRANREYLAALRPVGPAFCLSTMHFADEILGLDQMEGVPEEMKIDERQLKMARQLIDDMTTSFDPTKYRDEYRDAVRDLVRRKAAGKEVVTPPPVEEAKVIDLMTALEESLAQARQAQPRQGAPRKRKAAR